MTIPGVLLTAILILQCFANSQSVDEKSQKTVIPQASPNMQAHDATDEPLKQQTTQMDDIQSEGGQESLGAASINLGESESLGHEEEEEEDYDDEASSREGPAKRATEEAMKESNLELENMRRALKLRDIEQSNEQKRRLDAENRARQLSAALDSANEQARNYKAEKERIEKLLSDRDHSSAINDRNLRTLLQEEKEKIQDIELANEELKSTNIQLEKEKIELQNALTKERISAENLKRTVDELKNEKGELEEAINERKNSAGNLVNEIIQLRNEKTELLKALEEEKKSAANLKIEIGQLESEKTALQKALSEEKNSAKRFEEDRTKLYELIRAKAETMKELGDDNEKLKKKLVELEEHGKMFKREATEHETLKGTQKKFLEEQQNYKRAVEKMLRDGKEKIEKLLAENARLRHESEEMRSIFEKWAFVKSWVWPF